MSDCLESLSIAFYVCSHVYIDRIVISLGIEGHFWQHQANPSEAFNTSLSSLITGWTQLEISLGSISRVRSFEMETAPEESTEKNDPPADWPDRGVIEYRGVTAEYK